MKLKLVVASMSVLGLISCNAFADTQATTTNTTTTVKHKHHHHYHHRAAVAQQATVVEHTYKDMGALPVEVCPKVDMYDSLLDGMSHNIGRAKPTVHCADPLSLAGGMAFDTIWGNRHQGYSGENTARMSLNDAYVNVYGNMNEWSQAFASISYSDFRPYGSSTAVPPNAGPGAGYLLNGVYSASYSSNQLQLEQGFVTLKNVNVTPFFLRLGKMFEDFGRYNIHPITESFTQVMSESLHTSAQLGFLTGMGLNGSLYAFENPLRQVQTNGSYNSHNKTNYGISLNFNQPNDQLGYMVGGALIYDFTGIDQIANGVNTFNGANGSYQHRVAGGTVYGALNTGPFTLGVNYVSALQNFNSADLGTKTAAAATQFGNQSGAQPWAADITGGYGFSAWGKDQNVYLGYQASGNAVNVYLPRSRWMAGYGLNVWKSTNLGLQLNHDQAYNTTTGGSSESSNNVTLRAAVQFG